MFLSISLNRYLILREMKNIKIRHGDTEPEKLKSSPRGRNGEWLRQEEQAKGVGRSSAWRPWHDRGRVGIFPSGGLIRSLSWSHLGCSPWFCPSVEEELHPKGPTTSQAN